MYTISPIKIFPSQLGYEHLKVNHSKNFRDPKSGAHTNGMEGTWAHAKRAMPAFNRNRKFFVGYLASFMLKRKWAEEEDGFECFRKAAAQLYKNKQESEHLDPNVFAGNEEDDGELLEPCIFSGENSDSMTNQQTPSVEN